MSTQGSFATYAAGAVVGSVAAIVPDEAAGFAVKLVTAIVVASVSGLVHGFFRRLAAGKRAA